jgi:hypothetical protein
MGRRRVFYSMRKLRYKVLMLLATDHGMIARRRSNFLIEGSLLRMK